MAKVKLTIVESRCRCEYYQTGDEFIVEDLCPPICHELWNVAYPYIFTLLNEGTLDYSDKRHKAFDVKCLDENRVLLHGEIID